MSKYESFHWYGLKKGIYVQLKTMDPEHHGPDFPRVNTRITHPLIGSFSVSSQVVQLNRLHTPRHELHTPGGGGGLNQGLRVQFFDML